MLPWDEIYSKNGSVIMTLFIGNIIVFALIFVLITLLLQKVVIKEISAVTDSLNEFSEGNFDKKIEVKKSSEMYALAESINKTLGALKKERVESEVEITAILRNSLKPADIPNCPDIKFTAEIITATDIGGNLCDFFKINNDYFAVLFANVPEKGISQGIYMIKVRNILKKALLKNRPEKALSIVNAELFNSEDENIPLKTYLGILNLRSGVFQKFNSGYVDPVHKHFNGGAGFVNGPFSPMLGSSPNISFIQLPLALNKGDCLYFYSNDILDIQNDQGEKYGRNRLLNAITSSENNAQDIIKAIRLSVKDFAGESSLNEDIAVAVLEYTPQENKK